MFKRVPVFNLPLSSLNAPPPLSGFASNSILLSTYPLSCYTTAFGWGLSGDIQEITSNYRFYSFVPILTANSNYIYQLNGNLKQPFNTYNIENTYLDLLSGYSKRELLKEIYRDGVLNWVDSNQTILYNTLTSVSSWWSPDNQVNNIIDYTFKKGVGVLE